MLAAVALAGPVRGLRAQGVPDDLPADIVLAPRPTELRVDVPWTTKNRQGLFHQKPTSTLWEIRSAILFESPLPLVPIVAPLADPFSTTDAGKIADVCKAMHSEHWNRIGCVSHEVHKFFKARKLFEDGGRRGIRSFCRSHAQAFNASFKALGIKQSWAMTIDASGGGSGENHVVNLIILPTNVGTFSYAIDSGNYPGILFPENLAAIRLHSRGVPDVTKFFELPAIQPDAVLRFSAAEKK